MENRSEAAVSFNSVPAVWHVILLCPCAYLAIRFPAEGQINIPGFTLWKLGAKLSSTNWYMW